MGKAKQIILKVIPAKIANDFIRKNHYSGKYTMNSQLHFGVFYKKRLHGAMSFGCGIDKRKTIGLVRHTKWNGFLELNRMAFDDVLPKNSESRAIAISFKLLKRKAPHIKWVLSYSDSCQCGDGAIYRASGFHLTGIKKNTEIGTYKGEVIAGKTLDNQNYPKIDGRYLSNVLKESGEFKLLQGFQLRYIYFIDKSKINDLTVPILPFSKIDEMGAGMYKGKKISIQDRKNASMV